MLVIKFDDFFETSVLLSGTHRSLPSRQLSTPTRSLPSSSMRPFCSFAVVQAERYLLPSLFMDNAGRLAVLPETCQACKPYAYLPPSPALL